MSLAIISSGNFENGIPFGNIVAEDNLKFALRANSADSLIDLSDSEYSISNDAGFITAGIIGNGTTGANINATINENMFTVFVTAKVDLKTLNTGNTWICGNILGLTSGFGINVRTEGDASNIGKFAIGLRPIISIRQADGVSYSSAAINIAHKTNLDNVAQTTGWVVLACRFNYTKKLFTVKEMRSGAVATAPVTAVYFENGGALAANRNQDITAIGKWWNCRTANAANSAIAESVTVAESLYFNRDLTDAEIAQQFEYTKTLLAGRGITI